MIFLLYFQFIWEQLYLATPVSGREPGTLYNFRQCFKLVNVPSKVTNNYSACESLMLSATKAYLCDAFMTWAGMPNLDALPSWFKEVQTEQDQSAQWQILQFHLGKFVDEFVLTEFDVEKAWREQVEQREEQIREQQIRVQQSLEQQSPMTTDSATICAADQTTNTQDAKTPGMLTKIQCSSGRYSYSPPPPPPPPTESFFI